MGSLPHGPQGLLGKIPQDLHREDIKPLAGPSADERLVNNQNNFNHSSFKY